MANFFFSFLEEMGASNSALTQDQLDEYVQLTYLNKTEINFILKKFATIDAQRFARDIHARFTSSEVASLFTELWYNPFADRIFKVFSTQPDGSLSFEEFVNLCSVFSENCPLEVKGAWAFLIFDFDEDNQITKSDICELIDRITGPIKLIADEKNHICDVLLAEMDLQHLGGMNQMEFLHAIRKIPDFAQVFSFKP